MCGCIQCTYFKAGIDQLRRISRAIPWEESDVLHTCIRVLTEIHTNMATSASEATRLFTITIEDDDTARVVNLILVAILALEA
jgi:hypothetical protein